MSLLSVIKRLTGRDPSHEDDAMRDDRRTEATDRVLRSNIDVRDAIRRDRLASAVENSANALRRTR